MTVALQLKTLEDSVTPVLYLMTLQEKPQTLHPVTSVPLHVSDSGTSDGQHNNDAQSSGVLKGKQAPIHIRY